MQPLEFKIPGNAGDFETWTCVTCGAPADGRAGAKDRMAGRCFGCDEDFRNTPTRGEVLRGMNVPAAYRGEFVNPAAWPEEFAGRGPVSGWSGSPWSLVISGPTGSGKTWLGTELFARYAIAKRFNRGGMWLRSSALAADLAGHDRDRVRREVAAARIILIDDYGREFSPQARLQLGEVLTERFDWNRPTVLTTNLEIVDDKGLSALDPALWRRLREGWLCEVRGRWRP